MSWVKTDNAVDEIIEIVRHAAGQAADRFQLRACDNSSSLTRSAWLRFARSVTSRMIRE